LLSWSAGPQFTQSAAATLTTITNATDQLSSRSAGDVVSEDWWLRFSDYRLEDYYAVQAKIDNDAGRPFPVVPASTPPPEPLDLQAAVYGQDNITSVYNGWCITALVAFVLPLGSFICEMARSTDTVLVMTHALDLISRHCSLQLFSRLS